MDAATSETRRQVKETTKSKEKEDKVAPSATPKPKPDKDKGKKDKPLCPYGTKCYRYDFVQKKNNNHKF